MWTTLVLNWFVLARKMDFSDRYCAQWDPSAPNEKKLLWLADPDINEVAEKYCYEGWNEDGSYWDGKKLFKLNTSFQLSDRKSSLDLH